MYYICVHVVQCTTPLYPCNYNHVVQCTTPNVLYPCNYNHVVKCTQCGTQVPIIITNDHRLCQSPITDYVNHRSPITSITDHRLRQSPIIDITTDHNDQDLPIKVHHQLSDRGTLK